MKEVSKNPTNEVFYNDRVRDYSREILNVSGDILQINERFEIDLANQLIIQKAEINENHNLLVDATISEDNELGLTLFLDVVNFCYQNPFSKEVYVYASPDGKFIKRATGLKAAMRDSKINWGNTREVSQISSAQWNDVIQLDRNKDFYLGMDRGTRIAEFAGKLSSSGFKSVMDLLIFSEYDAGTLLPILAKSGYFNDDFQKRSQLAINMMDGVLKRRFDRELKNTTDLTVMADYRLPQIMYNFGVIELSTSLKQKLLDQKVIDSGSPEELALRAASVIIGEKLSKLLKINECDVDNLLWNLAHKMEDEKRLAIPHMLVATDKY